MSPEQGRPRAMHTLSSAKFRPFRTEIQNIGERTQRDPQDLFTHDIRHVFQIAISPRFYEPEAIQALYNLVHLPASELRMVTDDTIAEAVAKLPPELEPADPANIKRLEKLAMNIRPFLGEIIPVMRDSIGFLTALSGDTRAGSEKEWLQKLYSRKLPLKPIVDFYEGTFFIDSFPVESNDFEVNGVLFMIIHNIAKNAQVHGQDMGDEDWNQFGFVNYFPESRIWAIMSYNSGTEYELLQYDLSPSNESLGLVATRAYAALLRKRIFVDSNPIDDDNLTEAYRNLVDKVPESVVEFRIS